MKTQDMVMMTYITARSLLKVLAIIALLIGVPAYVQGYNILPMLGIMSIIIIWNALGQTLWATLMPRLGKFDIRRILVGRAFVLNAIVLPLLFALSVGLEVPSMQHFFAGAMMAMSASVPLGILAVIAISDVVAWYHQTPYVVDPHKNMAL